MDSPGFEPGASALFTYYENKKGCEGGVIPLDHEPVIEFL